MAGTRDYPLAGVLGAGNLIHHARPAGLLGKRIETRCGLEGDKTDRDGGIWCPDCLALERAKTGTHDERAGDGDPYDWDPVYAAATIDRLQKALAAATARAEKAEAERDEVEAVRGHQRAEVDLLAASNIDLRHRREKAEALVAELRTRRDHCVAREITAKIEARLLRREVAELRDAMGVDALQDGRSGPVERSETSGGIGTASNSSTGTAGLSEAAGGCPWCGTRQKLDADGLVSLHRLPNDLLCPGGTRRPNDDTTEDGQHG